MSQRGLEALLRPKSIAVLGASQQPGRAGNLMMSNLLAGGFGGPILPVTPRYKAVCGVMAYPDVASLPLTPDLAIICTHAKRNLALIEALGQRGCKTAIVLSSPPEQFAELKACAQRYVMRLLGPNSLGLLAPWQGINASFSPVPIQKGKLAFISQSAAVANTILDWAQQREVGFSYFIALGDSLDIDVDDLLDFLARDSKTSAILLYLENISDARRFLSASRSASRNKPILVIKSGRSQQAQLLLNSQLGLDAAYDAAIQRAGLLRVQDTHELFSAVETLSHMHPLRGERLMIVSNGAAPAAMALDELLGRNGKLATLSDESLAKLSDALPDFIRAGNPLDLRDDATPQRFLAAIEALLDSHDYDALLLIHAPSAAAPGTATADRRAASPCARQAHHVADQLVRRILFSRGAPAVYRGRHSHLPHPGRRGDRLYAYGGIPPQSEAAERDAGAADRPHRQHRRRPPPYPSGAGRRRHPAGYPRGAIHSAGL